MTTMLMAITIKIINNYINDGDYNKFKNKNETSLQKHWKSHSIIYIFIRIECLKKGRCCNFFRSRNFDVHVTTFEQTNMKEQKKKKNESRIRNEKWNG